MDANEFMAMDRYSTPDLPVPRYASEQVRALYESFQRRLAARMAARGSRHVVTTTLPPGAISGERRLRLLSRAAARRPAGPVVHTIPDNPVIAAYPEARAAYVREIRDGR